MSAVDSFSEIAKDFILYRLDPPIVDFTVTYNLRFFHYTGILSGILSPTSHQKKKIYVQNTQ